MKIKVNGIELYYEKKGIGSPLIMLHGNQENHHIFNELSETLAKDFEIYLLDSRSHGESSYTLDLTYELMAQDVMCFVHEMKLTHVTLLGFSDGAITGIHVANQKPDWLENLVLCGANTSVLGIYKKDNLEIIEENSKNPSIYLSLMIHQKDISKASLKQIKAKTLVIAGEYDLIKKNHTKMIANHIPNAKLLILDQHNHFDYIVHNDLLAPYIKSFI